MIIPFRGVAGWRGWVLLERRALRPTGPMNEEEEDRLLTDLHGLPTRRSVDVDAVLSRLRAYWEPLHLSGSGGRTSKRAASVAGSFAPFLVRLVKQCLHDLGSKEAQRLPHEVHETWLTVAREGLEHLQALRPFLVCGPFDIEKLMYTLALRLLDAKQLVLAITLFHRILAMLCFPNTKNGTPSAWIRRPTSTDTKLECVTLIVATLCGKASVLAEQNDEEALSELAKDVPSAAIPWLTHLYAMDRTLSTRQTQAMFRVLWNAASRVDQRKDQDLSLPLALRTQATELLASQPEFDVGFYVEQVAKASAFYDRTTTRGNPALVAFNRTAYTTLIHSPSAQNELHKIHRPSFVVWLDHLAAIIAQTETGVEEAMNVIRTAMEHVERSEETEERADPTNIGVSRGILLLRRCVVLLRMADGSPLALEALEEAIEALGPILVQWNKYDPSYVLGMIQRATRAMESLKRSFVHDAEVLAAQSQAWASALERAYTWLANAIRTGIRVESLLAPKMREKPRFGVSWGVLADASCLAAQVTVVGWGEEGVSRAVEYLVAAENTLREMGALGELRWLASSYFNIGVRMYNNGRALAALDPFDRARNLFTEWEETAEAGEHGKGQLAKRHFFCALARHRVGDCAAMQDIRQAVMTSPELRSGLATEILDLFVRVSLTLPSPLRTDGKGKKAGPGCRKQPKATKEWKLAHILRDLSPPLSFEQAGRLQEEELRLYSLRGGKEARLRRLELADDLLHLYDNPQHIMGRARVLVERAHATGRDKIAAVRDAEEAIEILKQHNATGVDTIPTFQDQLANAYCCLGTLKRDASFHLLKPFRIAVRLWSKLVKRELVKDEVSQNLSRIVCPSTTYRNLLGCADVFGLLEHTVHRIHVLKLIIVFNERVRRSRDAFGDTIAAYAAIGDCYRSLGYTTRATDFFDKAHSLVERAESGSLSPRLEVHVGTLHARYLTEVGQTTEGDAMATRALNMLTTQLKRTREDVLTLSMCHSVLATTRWKQGLIDSAFQEVLQARGILSSLLRTSVIHDGEEENTQKKTKEEEEGGGEDGDEQPETSTSDLVVTEFRVLRDFGEILHQAGLLYEWRGSPREAEFYYRQGLKLGQTITAPNIVVRFQLDLAELEFQRHAWEASAQSFEAVLLCLRDYSDKQVQAYRWYSIVTNTRMSDLYVHQGHLQDAYVRLQRAETEIREMTVPSFLINLEATRMGGAETPGETRVLGVETPPSAIKRATRDSFAPEDCHSFSATLARVLAKQAKILFLQGDLDGAESRLSRALEQPSSDEEQALGRFYLGEVYMERAHRNGELDQAWRLAPSREDNTALMIPRKGKKGRRNEKTTLLAQARQHLQESLSLSLGACPAFIRRDVSRTLSFAYGRAATTEAIECLHASMGITLGHQMHQVLQWRVMRAKTSSSTATEMLAASLDGLELASSQSRSKRKPCRAKEQALLDRLQSLFTPGPAGHAARLDTGDHLVVSRIQAGRIPSILRLPLRTAEVLRRFTDLMRECKENTTRAPSMTTDSQKTRWWEERFELDAKLCSLLRDTENSVVGCWKCLLVGRSHDVKVDERARSTAQEAMTFAQESLGIPGVDEDLLACCCASFLAGASSAQDIRACVAALLGDGDGDGDGGSQQGAVDHLITFMKKHLENVQSAPDDGTTRSTRSSRRRGARSTTPSVPSSESAETMTKQRGPVILILDKSLQDFPWECLPVLDGHPVTRMPSLPFILSLLMRRDEEPTCTPLRDGVDPSRVFYILNPSCDLSHTQQTFESWFTSKHTWHGVVGRAPTPDEFEHGLTMHDLFIYCGHGAGEQYLRGERLQRLERCAVALLMGCSSGLLRGSGEFEPEGTSLSYILAGCPAVVANLWDVTDKDIDRFSSSLLHTWVEGQRGTSLADIIPLARRACKLRYLTGASPVYYGLPVEYKRETSPCIPPQGL